MVFYYFLFLQDTVIALQALAAYGEATYISVTQNLVKITSKKPFEKVFIVNNENRLLLQQTPLPEVPGKYSLTVNGSGCVLMQVSVCSPLHCVLHSSYNTVMFLMILNLISLYFSSLFDFPKLFKYSFPQPTFWLLWSHSMVKKSPF